MRTLPASTAGSPNERGLSRLPSTRSLRAVRPTTVSSWSDERVSTPSAGTAEVAPRSAAVITWSRYTVRSTTRTVCALLRFP